MNLGQLEKIDFVCGACDQSNWKIAIGHSSNETKLILTCRTPSCNNLIDEDGDAVVPVAIFDVTGQGVDKEEIDSTREPEQVN